MKKKFGTPLKNCEWCGLEPCTQVHYATGIKYFVCQTCFDLAKEGDWVGVHKRLKPIWLYKFGVRVKGEHKRGV